MNIDYRPFLVLGPIVFVAGWAAFNIIRAAIKGEAKLFGEKGNNPFG
jgi:photosystem II PsbY protein